MDSPARRRTADIPKTETGLAEWTSRIKALQRDVDADEEAEQRKLEEEIRSSRLARSRRSGGMQYTDRLDLEQPSSPTVAVAADRTTNQADALRKLVGESPASTPASPPPAERKVSGIGSAAHAPMPGSTKAEPVSLAAFMGGRATGPRLNRPAAQPDAHDPTLFEQRTRADIAAPHPVFGSGGVALAGLASKGREVIEPRPVEEPRKAAHVVTGTPAKNWSRERTISTPSPFVPKASEKLAKSPSPVPLHTGQGVRGRVESLYGNANRSVERVSTPTLMRNMKSTEKLSQKPVTPVKPDTLRRPLPTIEPPRQVSPAPHQTPAASTNSRPASVSPPISTPSLARPVQPPLRPMSTGPQVPLSKKPAPAFLKPPQQKDLTPSLSRLQGRGFVQSFVKLSTEIEAASAGSTPERSASPRKASVLDRWNPQPHGSPRPAKSSPKAKNDPRLGSSNTLISYIKPTKTGDNPATDSPEPRQRSKTPSKQVDDYGASSDELGMRPRSRSRSRSNSAAKPSHASPLPSKAKSDLSSVASGRPLSHPTKDRARARRKGASSTVEPAPVTVLQADDSVLQTSPVASEVPPASPLCAITARLKAPPSPIVAHAEEVQPPATIQTQARGEKIRRLQDTWANQSPIAVKPLRKIPLASPSPTRTTFSPTSTSTKVNKHALPGLTRVDTAVPPPSPPLTPPLTTRSDNRPSASPSRHARIPSTGSRPTVMDVAQTFNASSSPTTLGFPKSPTSPKSPRSPISSEDRERNSGGWGEADNERTITPATVKAERRSFTLPALMEEKTPAPSPAGTLKNVDVAAINAVALSGVKGVEEGVFPVVKPVPAKKPDFIQSSKVSIDVANEPIPSVNAASIWDQNSLAYKPDPDQHTVSVDVLNVDGSSTNEVAKGDFNVFVFYDSETLAIVHRSKSRSSGLVTSKVWAWQGRKAEAGEREEKKLQELAKRYSSNLIKCAQSGEPQELVHILGGTLIARQGKRSLWSPDNTTMHRVRSWKGLILIDEVDLNVRYLCSGFSYCICVLDTLWVWYGCGSTPAERNAALGYAQTLASEKNLVEVEEGQEDEMFWMFLGDEGYAKADYWKWRKVEKGIDPRIWRVDCSKKGSEITEAEVFDANEVANAVLVLHLAYEIFVLVGSSARGERRDIRLGLTLAQELSSHTARSKPFRPPVHVLILPSQIPLDLQAAIRGLDEETLHGSEVPDHMNLLTLDNAWTHIQRKEWDSKDLEDGGMMPLGLTPQ
ncbi:hypothetical protein DFH11DRAFT_1540265 [Phellopilus nigrolimitatus]|nr:hypothetical protein DFH11DRAFT_1540265 [Phellopilus nigrolimitatus]